MNKKTACVAFSLLLAACANPYDVEGPKPQTDAEWAAYLPQRSFKEGERMYCYQQLAGVACYAKPVHRDTARLIWHPGSNDPAPDLPKSPRPY